MGVVVKRDLYIQGVEVVGYCTSQRAEEVVGDHCTRQGVEVEVVVVAVGTPTLPSKYSLQVPAPVEAAPWDHKLQL